MTTHEEKGSKLTWNTQTMSFLKTTILWNVALCRLVGVFSCFRRSCCLYHQGRCWCLIFLHISVLQHSIIPTTIHSFKDI